MRTLEESRKAIDDIDQELVKLFEERFRIVEDVVAYKKENNLPIFDANREATILERNKQRLTNHALEPYFISVYQHLMDVSKQYQEDILKGE